MRRLSALALVLGLLMVSTIATAERDDDRRERPFHKVGDFRTQEPGSVTGEHVQFRYDAQGIAGFRVGDREIFDLTVVPDDERDDRRASAVDKEGAQIVIRTDSYLFRAHDAPAAASRVRTEGTATLTFADGAVLARENGKSIRFSLGALTGTVRGEDLVMSGRTVTFEEDLLFVLDAPRGPFDKNHRELGRAIGKGSIGAEQTLLIAEDSSVVEDSFSYNANVTITTLKAERGNITVAIDGHGQSGRVVVLNVDGRVLGADRADNLNILIDNETVRPATDLADILDPDDDGYRPEYYIVFDPQTEAFQLLVTFPHYSVHILSVTTAMVPPSVVIGVVAGLALLVPTALVLFRRK